MGTNKEPELPRPEGGAYGRMIELRDRETPEIYALGTSLLACESGPADATDANLKRVWKLSYKLTVERRDAISAALAQHRALELLVTDRGPDQQQSVYPVHSIKLSSTDAGSDTVLIVGTDNGLRIQ